MKPTTEAQLLHQIKIAENRVARLRAQLHALKFDGSFDRELLARIVAFVALEFGLRESDITGPGRREPAVTARHVCMWWLRTEHHWSTTEIANAFGKLDHTTALNATTAVENRLRIEPEFRARVARLRKVLP